jgi:hypothetical protein
MLRLTRNVAGADATAGTTVKERSATGKITGWTSSAEREVGGNGWTYRVSG